MCVGEPHVFSPLVRRYIEHPKICEVLRVIVGAHIPFWDGGVKVYAVDDVRAKYQGIPGTRGIRTNTRFQRAIGRSSVCGLP